MDKDEIKKALDKFEDDDFVGSKEILSKEIQDKVKEYIKDKTELSKDVNDEEE